MKTAILNDDRKGLLITTDQPFDWKLVTDALDLKGVSLLVYAPTMARATVYDYKSDDPILTVSQFVEFISEIMTPHATGVSKFNEN